MTEFRTIEHENGTRERIRVGGVRDRHLQQQRRPRGFDRVAALDELAADDDSGGDPEG